MLTSWNAKVFWNSRIKKQEIFAEIKLINLAETKGLLDDYLKQKQESIKVEFVDLVSG